MAHICLLMKAVHLTTQGRSHQNLSGQVEIIGFNSWYLHCLASLFEAQSACEQKHALLGVWDIRQKSFKS